jgi:hypothetical protein
MDPPVLPPLATVALPPLGVLAFSLSGTGFGLMQPADSEKSASKTPTRGLAWT